MIKDQQASRRHCRINVTDVVTITDLGSKNGVVVDGVAIASPKVLRPGQDAEIGDLRLTIRDHLRAVEAVASRNRVEFNRPPRVTRPYGGTKVELPAPPERPRKQRIPAISAAIPVVLGIGMYFWLGPLGAVFMLLSPILLIGSWIEAKRNGRFEFKEKLAEHQQLLAEHVEQLEAERMLEVRSRFRETPGAGELARWCARCRTACGSGRPTTPTSSGCGSARRELPSRTSITIANGGDRDLRAEVETIPGRFQLLDDVPLAVDVLAHRGVGIAGPLHAARALARSLVLQAATMQSPTDLAVVALVGEGGLHDWTFLKWLPHARTLGGSQLASTSHHALTSSTTCSPSAAGAVRASRCRPCWS